MASRIASFNSRPGSRTHSRLPSPGSVSGPGGNPSSLQHSASFTSRNTSSASVSSRSRSHSLLGSTTPTAPIPSPNKESKFNVFRSSSQKDSPTRTPSTMRNLPANRPASLPVSNGLVTDPRQSFGLPKIEQGFEGLGKIGRSSSGRSTKMPSPVPRVSSPAGVRGGSPVAHVPEEEEDDSPSVKQEKKLGEKARLKGKKSGQLGLVRQASNAALSSRMALGADLNAGLGLGDVDISTSSRRQPAPTTTTVSKSPSSSQTPSSVPAVAAPSHFTAIASGLIPSPKLSTTFNTTRNQPAKSQPMSKGRSRDSVRVRRPSTHSVKASTSSSASDGTATQPPTSYPMSKGRSKDGLGSVTTLAAQPPSQGGMTRSASTPVISNPAYASSVSSASSGGAANGRPARPKGRGYEVDASEGWRNEPVLYQCACVAEL